MALYEIPRAFYDDHVARALPAGTIVREKRKTIVVDMDDDEARELLDDAKHYAGAPAGYWEGVSMGLISSARATAKRLVAAGVDSGPSSHEMVAAQRRFVFVNPDPDESSKPRTFDVGYCSTENDARRRAGREIERCAKWPVQVYNVSGAYVETLELRAS